jgi:hypothetical protein
MLRFQLCRAPGEDRGTATALIAGFRHSASGSSSCFCFQLKKVSGAGLTDLEAQAPEPFLMRRVPSHLWLDTGPRLLWIPSHSREAEFVAWDCKVTPAGCACQGRNTTGCIPSNDALDAGFEPGFPHCGKPEMAAVEKSLHESRFFLGFPRGWLAASCHKTGSGRSPERAHIRRTNWAEARRSR